MDVSIRTLLRASHFFTRIIWRHINQSKFKVFLLQFSSHRIVSFWDAHLKKPAMPIVQPHQNKFRVFLLIAHNWWSKNYFWVRISKYPFARLLKLWNFSILFCSWSFLCLRHIDFVTPLILFQFISLIHSTKVSFIASISYFRE